MRADRTDDDRGQAYTLEGFVGAIIVLTAVLFALQSVVVTPTTGGSVDRSAQAQLQQEVEDALLVAENDGELSRLVRYWNTTDEEYYNRSDLPRGRYGAGAFGDEFDLGAVLEARFLNESGRNYNVLLTYWNATSDEREEIPLVYQGGGSPNEQSASYTVTLYDDQTLTAPGSRHETLADAREDGAYPIPNVDDGSELYNVVEIRVIVW